MGKVILIIVVIIAIVGIFVACNGGFGFGKGGEGDGKAVHVDGTASETVKETEETTETTKVEKTIIGVNIDEEKYYYNNNPKSLDDLMSEISKIEGKVEVHISISDTATLAALEALETRLDKEKIIHYVVDKTE